MPSLLSRIQSSQTSPPPSPSRREDKQVDTVELEAVPEGKGCNDKGVDTSDLVEALKELTGAQKPGKSLAGKGREEI